MKSEGKYTETFGVSAQIGEIYRRCQDISSNQGDIQKVSGYLPKSGRYTESFRIINSWAASHLSWDSASKLSVNVHANLFRY